MEELVKQERRGMIPYVYIWMNILLVLSPSNLNTVFSPIYSCDVVSFIPHHFRGNYCATTVTSRRGNTTTEFLRYLC